MMRDSRTKRVRKNNLPNYYKRMLFWVSVLAAAEEGAGLDGEDGAR